jgi:cell division protease FtsH
VVVNAQPLDTGAPWWQNLLLGFGPTILFVGLLFWLMRRAGNVQNVLGSFGRSRARRYQPSGRGRRRQPADRRDVLTVTPSPVGRGT